MKNTKLHQPNEKKKRRYAENRSAENRVNKQMLIQQEEVTTQGSTAWRKKQQINV
jgi:hypothetical protein